MQKLGAGGRIYVSPVGGGMNLSTGSSTDAQLFIDTAGNVAAAGGISATGIRIGTSATAGDVLTTDASGNGTWQADGLDLPYAGTAAGETSFNISAMAMVAEEISGNHFMIKTNLPNTKVSWEVKALRNDLWVQRYGAPVELEKGGAERGTYQHPELYGQPPTKSVHHQVLDNTDE